MIIPLSCPPDAIHAGLATAEREKLKAGQSIGRIRITEAGRRALEGY
jgi:hypothetical protein